MMGARGIRNLYLLLRRGPQRAAKQLTLSRTADFWRDKRQVFPYQGKLHIPTRHEDTHPPERGNKKTFGKQ